VAVAILLLTACSSDDSADQAPRVLAALDAVQRAFTNGDLDAVCARLSVAAKNEVGEIAHGQPTACARDLRRFRRMIAKGSGWDSAGSPQPEGVTVHAGGATVLAELRDRSVDLPFVEEGGRWKLESFMGTPKARTVGHEIAVRRASFPEADGSGVRASTSGQGRSPCFEFYVGDFPEIGSSACELNVIDGEVALDVVSSFGQFRFGVCTVDYTIRADGQGRTWSDVWFDSLGLEFSGCGDVEECLTEDGTEIPWRGRLREEGPGRLLHVMDVCFRTCVGYFKGRLASRLVRRAGRWKAWTVDSSVGRSGFHLTGGAPLEPHSVDFGPASS